MTEYFLGLIAFAFVGAVVFSLVPSGAAKRYVRLLFGLCAVGCVAFPLLELSSNASGGLNDFASLFEADTTVSNNSVEIYNNFLNDAGVKNAEDALKSDLIKRLSAKYDDIDVKISVGENSGEFYIIGVTVWIYPSGYHLNPKKIENICEERLSAECSVVYK